jgi:hypothetical protein
MIVFRNERGKVCERGEDDSEEIGRLEGREKREVDRRRMLVCCDELNS